MSWPEELKGWAERLVVDELAIRAVNQRARNTERAKEALQRALVDAQRLYPRWKNEGWNYERFRGWMCWKADKLLIDEFRHLQRLRPLDGEPPRDERTTDREMQAALLREVMAELSPEEQRLLQLRLAGFSLAEIGQQEGGLAAGTIHRRLQAPLHRLRQRLLEEDEELFREYTWNRGAAGSP
jgi:RNA polymerase sigma factor (sigma-70 family)